jgi:hypothetical protein
MNQDYFAELYVAGLMANAGWGNAIGTFLKTLPD